MKHPSTVKRSFKIPIYFGTFSIICTDNLQVEAQNVGCEFDTHGFAALSFKKRNANGTRHYYIILGPHATPGALVHECQHTVNFIFKDIDVRLDVENDEPSCYLIQWVFDKAHSVFITKSTQ